MSNSALFVIDMQTTSINQENPLLRRSPAHLSRQIDNINLLAGWAVGRVPVFVVESYCMGPTISYLSPLFAEGRLEEVVKYYDSRGRQYDANSSSSRFREGVQLIVKSFFNAFDGTGLDSRLSKAGVDTLVVAGVEASCCVLETVKSAVSRNKVVVTSEFFVSEPLSIYGSYLITYEWAMTYLKKNTVFLKDAASAIKLLS